MILGDRLVARFLDEHPDDAARVLETVAPIEAADALGVASVPIAATVLSAMTSAAGAAVLAAMPRDAMLAVARELPTRALASLTRRMTAEVVDPLLQALGEDRARGIRAVMSHPDGTAASLMDPSPPTVAFDATVADAVASIRSATAAPVVFAVDREQRLRGSVETHELLLAQPSAAVATLVTPTPATRASATTAEMLAHPAWARRPYLPVVDDDDRLVGLVAYQTLRRVEADASIQPSSPVMLATNLGELMWFGLSGLLDGLGRVAAREQTP